MKQKIKYYIAACILSIHIITFGVLLFLKTLRDGIEKEDKISEIRKKIKYFLVIFLQSIASVVLFLVLLFSYIIKPIKIIFFTVIFLFKELNLKKHIRL